MTSGIYIRKPFSKEHKKNLSLSQMGRIPWNKGKKGLQTNTGRTHFKKGQFSNEKHLKWKGNEVSYSALHHWIEEHFGNPDTCEKCGKSGLKGKFIDWANISGKYKREREDWKRLCKKCHYHYDRDASYFLRESNKIENVWDDQSFAQAIQAWKYLNNQKTLTVRNLLKTHDILMKYHLFPPERGAFRTVPVWIGGRKAVNAVMVPGLMQVWLRQANQDTEETQIKRSHVSFEHIHGFIDGNGRLGRLLMLWQREKNNLPINVIYEKNKEEYYRWFCTPELMDA